MKAKAIILNTEYTGEIVQAEVNDEGKMVLGESEFDLERVKPILIKEPATGGGIRRRLMKSPVTPYFIMKQSTVLPFIAKTTDEKTKYNISCSHCGNLVMTYPAVRKTIEPLDLATYKTALSPKMQKETAEIRFLRQLKKYAEPKKGGFDKGMIKKVLIAVAIGVGGIFIMVNMGIIKL